MARNAMMSKGKNISLTKVTKNKKTCKISVFEIYFNKKFELVCYWVSLLYDYLAIDFYLVVKMIKMIVRKASFS